MYHFADYGGVAEGLNIKGMPKHKIGIYRGPIWSGPFDIANVCLAFHFNALFFAAEANKLPIYTHL